MSYRVNLFISYRSNLLNAWGSQKRKITLIIVTTSPPTWNRECKMIEVSSFAEAKSHIRSELKWVLTECRSLPSPIRQKDWHHAQAFGADSVRLDADDIPVRGDHYGPKAIATNRCCYWRTETMLRAENPRVSSVDGRKASINSDGRKSDRPQNSAQRSPMLRRRT
jgi:hypothetical protein